MWTRIASGTTAIVALLLLTGIACGHDETQPAPAATGGPATGGVYDAPVGRRSSCSTSMKAGIFRSIAILVVALALAGGGFGVYRLVTPGESAPQTAPLFPPSVPHKPVPVPLTDPVEWGPFRLLPVGWPAKGYQVVRPPEVEAKIAGQQRRETTDQAFLTNSALFQRYLGSLALPQGYVLDATEGVAFGDEVTWLIVTYRQGELMLRITLYPYIQPPFESNVPYDVTWEMATINGYKVIVDLVEPLPDTRAFIRALYGNTGIFFEGDLEDILAVAQQVLR